MNTSRIKRFAVDARNILRSGVSMMIGAMGFDEQGNTTVRPTLMQGATIFNGRMIPTEQFYHKWVSLEDAIRHHGLKQVSEEVAYTWFNRLMAIRIMSKNGFISPVLEFPNPTRRIPKIVEDARQGILPPMTEAESRELQELLLNPTKTTEQFSLLLIAYCHSNAVMQNCFGRLTDYTELLLPRNILAEDGIVDMINKSTFISDEDYKSPELIGWLYQFYISERKDEVMAKSGKYDADEVPAATQIFTPNWIVRYMVENTVGRIYLDNYGSSEIEMPYLVDTPSNDDARLKIEALEELTVIDPACGSGHILVEAFNLLYKMYGEQFVSRRQAIENILTKNIMGIDLDTRAKQLAQFSLLMCAAKLDSRFLDCSVMPRILDMPKPYDEMDTLRDTLPHFFMGGSEEARQETIEAFELLQQADELGSIMKFNLSEKTHNLIKVRLIEYLQQESIPKPIKKLIPSLEIILALTNRYATIVMNPPYMGSGRMNTVLKNYVNRNHTEAKADMFSVFMDVSIDLLQQNGKYGMINTQSWMFLSSFENFRLRVLKEQQIDSMLHLGAHTFDELSGEVVQNTAFIITKHEPSSQSVYYRLVDGKDCADKEQMFFNRQRAFHVLQSNFEKIPGCPIGYWISENILKIFEKSSKLDSFALGRVGMFTGDNNRFLRLWWEVDKCLTLFDCKSNEQSILSRKKWFPYNKGGASIKWYGNYDYVVNYENNGYEIYELAAHDDRNCQNYPDEIKFRECITWSHISSGNIGFRYRSEGSLMDIKGMFIMPYNGNLIFLLAFLNSTVANYLLSVISPTITTQVGEVKKLPIYNKERFTEDHFVKQNIAISKADWDAHETSWDFKLSPLLSRSTDCRLNVGDLDMLDEKEAKELMVGVPTNPHLLEHLYLAYCHHWERQTKKLRNNEEELNRQFIEIYGLQEELTPDVSLEDVTILQQGEADKSDGVLKFNAEVVIKQFISYAIGCMMGRYSLQYPGLILANQGDGIEQYEKIVSKEMDYREFMQVDNPSVEEDSMAAIEYSSYEKFRDCHIDIDDDGIIPLMDNESGFTDNAAHRFREFLRVALGEENLPANLNFVESCLGKTIEKYFAKDFWKDHKKMYQNRPIYWLFSSKKGAFQCIAYMHRMTPYTAAEIRKKYLLPYIERLTIRINTQEQRAAELTSEQRRALENDKKALAECREYHDRLHKLSEHPIPLDLDDGVIKNYAKFGDVLAKIK